MTQFAIVKLGVAAGEDVFRHLTAYPDGSLIAEATQAIFGKDANAYELAPNGRSFDELYLSAQREVADGGDVRSTELFDFLSKIRASVAQIALWYGDAFLDLPSVSSWENFHRALVRDIELPAFETYLHYRAAQSEPNGEQNS